LILAASSELNEKMHNERQKHTEYCYKLEKEMQLMQFKMIQAEKDLVDKEK